MAKAWMPCASGATAQGATTFSMKAAGALIVREAGGAALTWEGGRWRPIRRFRVPVARPKKPDGPLPRALTAIEKRFPWAPKPPQPPAKPAEPPKPKPKTLRDWSQPVLVAAPGAAGHVGAGLAPRTMPPATLIWAYKQRQAATAWWKKRGQKADAAKPDATSAAPSAAPASNGAPPATSA